MRSVLCVIAHYLPGYKAGGSLRSVGNLAALVADYCDFRILTSDRDLGDKHRYPTVHPGTWTRIGRYSVFYCSTPLAEIFSIVRGSATDVLYLNSFFDFRFSIWPLFVWRLFGSTGSQLVIAPRGEFSEGALRLKSGKKQCFVAFARMSGLYRNLIWHASTELEAQDIRRTIGDSARDIRIAQDVTAPVNRTTNSARIDKLARCRSPLAICFVSRISRKKNLDFALSVLRQVDVPVVFDIYGPVEDEAYRQHCETLIAQLPRHVSATIAPPIEHSRVTEVMTNYHLFFFPTLGENFGHVIAEALGAGTPVLLSDQTPWRQLRQHGVGWDLALDDPTAFVAAIQSIATMDAADYAEMRRRAAGHSLGPAPNRDPQDMLALFALPSASPSLDS